MKSITEYKPFNGFYDLRDYNLPKKDFIKLWRIQEYLHQVETNKKYFKSMAKNMWEEAKQLSANYQQCLFSYSAQQSLSGSDDKSSSPKSAEPTSDKLERCLQFQRGGK